MAYVFVLTDKAPKLPFEICAGNYSRKFDPKDQVFEPHSTMPLLEKGILEQYGWFEVVEDKDVKPKIDEKKIIEQQESISN